MDELPERLERVAAKLRDAAAQPGEPVMFGASSHGFRLGPPLSDDAVAEFERDHGGVELPADYRAFITTIGHGGPGQWGGAGPYYGLHPLDAWSHGYLNLYDAFLLAQPFPVEPGHVPDDWDVDDVDHEPFRGTLALSDEGCGFMSLLVVSGPARGRVVGNNDETGPSFTGDPDFLSWYERWLDAVLAGHEHFR